MEEAGVPGENYPFVVYKLRLFVLLVELELLPLGAPGFTSVFSAVCVA
jgi:hypothetical protein